MLARSIDRAYAAHTYIVEERKVGEHRALVDMPTANSSCVENRRNVEVLLNVRKHGRQQLLLDHETTSDKELTFGAPTASRANGSTVADCEERAMTSRP